MIGAGTGTSWIGDRPDFDPPIALAEVMTIKGGRGDHNALFFNPATGMPESCMEELVTLPLARIHLTTNFGRPPRCAPPMRLNPFFGGCTHGLPHQ